ncbi:MAG TPA: hypothetical protein PKG50_01550 [Candidatus Bipolaricaulis anaerobius]|nr:hypothetical protein [Candidatus Bipolaricaulis anaerobius]HNS23814.1 hypothetical protein [Candidatus Bipolaricaulis anaerobius]
MRIKVSVIALASVLAVGVGALGQAKLESFPQGTTTMAFRIVAEDLGEPQALELQVIAHPDGTYTVRMVLEASGTADQLSAFGFVFGAAGLLYGGGQDVSLAALQTLMDQRTRLQEGQEYALPGGGSFTDVAFVTIAGVQCIEGTIVDPRAPDAKTTVAFSLSHPVYTTPRVFVERRRDGRWQTVFSLELVGYTFVAG